MIKVFNLIIRAYYYQITWISSPVSVKCLVIRLNITLRCPIQSFPVLAQLEFYSCAATHVTYNTKGNVFSMPTSHP